MKISIYKFKDQLKISSMVFDKQGWEIVYTPVYIVETNDSESLVMAILDCLFKSQKIIDLGNFPEDEEVYRAYVTKMMKNLKEKSFDSLQKTSQEFFVEYSKDKEQFTITPLQWKKKAGGSVPIREKIKIISNTQLNNHSINEVIEYIQKIST